MGRAKKRNRGQRTERKILHRIHAQRVPASGAIPGLPNDGRKGRFLIEVKSTERESIGVKLEWLEQLIDDSALRDKVPALILIFNEARSEYANAITEWIAVPRIDFERITENWTISK